MGHVHLGELPRTKRWRQVVSQIEGGAEAAAVAQATMDAARAGLASAAKDKGMIEVVYLLMQLPKAARSGTFVEALAELGVVVEGAPTTAQITGATCDFLDDAISAAGRTDLNEMAQMAAIETLTEVLGRSSGGLFAATPDDVQRELAGVSSTRELGKFMRSFFSRLVTRYLGYYLSRELTHHVGEGRRFATLAQQEEYSQSLALHAHQAALIVERFSGEWEAKTRWEQGAIKRADIVKFTHGAACKLSEELLAGAR